MAATGVMRPALHNSLKSCSSQHVSLTFLIPSLSQRQTTSFSSSSPNAYPRDYNRERGVSSVRRTGPRQPLSVSKLPLPKPILDPAMRSKVNVDPDHGLWEFFHSKEKPMNTPEEDNEHGRSWSVEELRHKSWEDLHALWWMCCKERNRIATESHERERLKAGYGAFEGKRRDVTVRRTQRAIKQALTERYYSWDEARKTARNDPEVDISGQNQAYTPSNVFEEEYQEDDYHMDENSEEQEVSEEASGNAGTPPGGQPFEHLQQSTEQRPSPSS